MVKLKGSVVVEAAYLFPIIMIVWMLILFALFYYHDKNILCGAAYEAAVVGSELRREGELPQGKINQYFNERISGKLIFFPSASVTIEESKESIKVSARSSARGMSLTVVKSAAVTEPEKVIRKFRIGKENLEDIVNE